MEDTADKSPSSVLYLKIFQKRDSCFYNPTICKNYIVKVVKWGEINGFGEREFLIFI